MATKKCPNCAEEIQVEAIVCEHCGRDLPPPESTKVAKKSNRLGWGWKAAKWAGIFMIVVSFASPLIYATLGGLLLLILVFPPGLYLLAYALGLWIFSMRVKKVQGRVFLAGNIVAPDIKSTGIEIRKVARFRELVKEGLSLEEAKRKLEQEEERWGEGMTPPRRPSLH